MSNRRMSTCPPSVHPPVDMSTQSTPLRGGQWTTGKRIRWSEKAKTLWPEAVWVHGDGRFAVLAYCNELTVTLHESIADAKASRDFIDRLGCGRCCGRVHGIKVLRESSS